MFGNNPAVAQLPSPTFYSAVHRPQSHESASFVQSPNLTFQPPNARFVVDSRLAVFAAPITGYPNQPANVGRQFQTISGWNPANQQQHQQQLQRQSLRPVQPQPVQTWTPTIASTNQPFQPVYIPQQQQHSAASAFCAVAFPAQEILQPDDNQRPAVYDVGQQQQAETVERSLTNRSPSYMSLCSSPDLEQDGQEPQIQVQQRPPKASRKARSKGVDQKPHRAHRQQQQTPSGAAGDELDKLTANRPMDRYEKVQRYLDGNSAAAAVVVAAGGQRKKKKKHQQQRPVTPPSSSESGSSSGDEGQQQQQQQPPQQQQRVQQQQQGERNNNSVDRQSQKTQKMNQAAEPKSPDADEMTAMPPATGKHRGKHRSRSPPVKQRRMNQATSSPPPPALVEVNVQKPSRRARREAVVVQEQLRTFSPGQTNADRRSSSGSRRRRSRQKDRPSDVARLLATVQSPSPSTESSDSEDDSSDVEEVEPEPPVAVVERPRRKRRHSRQHVSSRRAVAMESSYAAPVVLQQLQPEPRGRRHSRRKDTRMISPDRSSGSSSDGSSMSCSVSPPPPPPPPQHQHHHQQQQQYQQQPQHRQHRRRHNEAPVAAVSQPVVQRQQMAAAPSADLDDTRISEDDKNQWRKYFADLFAYHLLQKINTNDASAKVAKPNNDADADSRKTGGLLPTPGMLDPSLSGADPMMQRPPPVQFPPAAFSVPPPGYVQYPMPVPPPQGVVRQQMLGGSPVVSASPLGPPMMSAPTAAARWSLGQSNAIRTTQTSSMFSGQTSGMITSSGLRQTASTLSTGLSKVTPAVAKPATVGQVTGINGRKVVRLFCNVCNWTAPNAKELHKHTETDAHRVNFRALMHNMTKTLQEKGFNPAATAKAAALAADPPSVQKPREYTCTVCAVTVEGTEMNHRRSDEHKKKAGTALRGCQLCKTGSFKTYPDYTAHIDGEEHKQRKIELDREVASRRERRHESRRRGIFDESSDRGSTHETEPINIDDMYVIDSAGECSDVEEHVDKDDAAKVDVAAGDKEGDVVVDGEASKTTVGGRETDEFDGFMTSLNSPGVEIDIVDEDEDEAKSSHENDVTKSRDQLDGNSSKTIAAAATARRASAKMVGEHQETREDDNDLSADVTVETLPETSDGEHSPRSAVGTEFVRQVTGYFCSVCNEMWCEDPGDSTLPQHCSTARHRYNYNKQEKEKALLTAAAEDEATEPAAAATDADTSASTNEPMEMTKQDDNDDSDVYVAVTHTASTPIIEQRDQSPSNPTDRINSVAEAHTDIKSLSKQAKRLERLMSTWSNTVQSADGINEAQQPVNGDAETQKFDISGTQVEDIVGGPIGTHTPQDISSPKGMTSDVSDKKSARRREKRHKMRTNTPGGSVESSSTAAQVGQVRETVNSEVTHIDSVANKVQKAQNQCNSNDRVDDVGAVTIDRKSTSKREKHRKHQTNTNGNTVEYSSTTVEASVTHQAINSGHQSQDLEANRTRVQVVGTNSTPINTQEPQHRLNSRDMVGDVTETKTDPKSTSKREKHRKRQANTRDDSVEYSSMAARVSVAQEPMNAETRSPKLDVKGTKVTDVARTPTNAQEPQKPFKPKDIVDDAAATKTDKKSTSKREKHRNSSAGDSVRMAQEPVSSGTQARNVDVKCKKVTDIDKTPVSAQKPQNPFNPKDVVDDTAKAKTETKSTSKREKHRKQRTDQSGCTDESLRTDPGDCTAQQPVKVPTTSETQAQNVDAKITKARHVDRTPVSAREAETPINSKDRYDDIAVTETDKKSASKQRKHDKHPTNTSGNGTEYSSKVAEACVAQGPIKKSINNETHSRNIDFKSAETTDIGGTPSSPKQPQKPFNPRDRVADTAVAITEPKPTSKRRKDRKYQADTSASADEYSNKSARAVDAHESVKESSSSESGSQNLDAKQAKVKSVVSVPTSAREPKNHFDPTVKDENIAIAVADAKSSEKQRKRLKRHYPVESSDATTGVFDIQKPDRSEVQSRVVDIDCTEVTDIDSMSTSSLEQRDPLSSKGRVVDFAGTTSTSKHRKQRKHHEDTGGNAVERSNRAAEVHAAQQPINSRTHSQKDDVKYPKGVDIVTTPIVTEERFKTTVQDDDRAVEKTYVESSAKQRKRLKRDYAAESYRAPTDVRATQKSVGSKAQENVDLVCSTEVTDIDTMERPEASSSTDSDSDDDVALAKVDKRSTGRHGRRLKRDNPESGVRVPPCPEVCVMLHRYHDDVHQPVSPQFPLERKTKH